MDSVHTYASDIAFTASVKAMQTRKGSRRSYKHMEERGSWQTRITPDLARFIEAQTSIFLATANAEGQPYIRRFPPSPPRQPRKRPAWPKTHGTRAIPPAWRSPTRATTAGGIAQNSSRAARPSKHS